MKAMCCKQFINLTVSHIWTKQWFIQYFILRNKIIITYRELQVNINIKCCVISNTFNFKIYGEYISIFIDIYNINVVKVNILPFIYIIKSS